MLLIGDIHINARYQDKIIEQLKTYVHRHSGEKNIIFSGDYVYHFSYDRNALLALYHFLLELLQEGKTIYILAGNHDRLGNSFVFEEARKAFDIVNSIAHDQGKLFFITQPQYHDIEGQQILFMPYTIDSKIFTTPQKVELPINIQWTIDLLNQSNNKNELLSAAVNEYLRSEIADKKDLLVIHHYYINNTKFPGQKSRFNYKDVALHEDILKQTNIKLISWHLHQAFAHDNYVCLGSVRSTTPLEINQNKFLFSYDTKKQTLQATQSDINPYIFVEQDNWAFSQEDLDAKVKSILVENKKSLESAIRNIEFVDNPPELNNIFLSIKTESIDYQNIDEYISPELRVQIRDIKLKKQPIELNELLKNFEISAKNLSTWFADWKDILKSYLQQKHADDYEKYEQKLKELKLL